MSTNDGPGVAELVRELAVAWLALGVAYPDPRMEGRACTLPELARRGDSAFRGKARALTDEEARAVVASVRPDLVRGWHP